MLLSFQSTDAGDLSSATFKNSGETRDSYVILSLGDSLANFIYKTKDRVQPKMMSDVLL